MCQDETKDYFDSILFGPGESNFINIIKDAKQNILKKIILMIIKIFHSKIQHFQIDLF